MVPPRVHADAGFVRRLGFLYLRTSRERQRRQREPAGQRQNRGDGGVGKQKSQPGDGDILQEVMNPLRQMPPAQEQGRTGARSG